METIVVLWTKYVELEITIDEYSPNDYFSKEEIAKLTNQLVKDLGTGEYDFFMGLRNKVVPSSRNNSRKIGLFLSDFEVGV